jgi:hypothetical protein
MNIVTPDRRAPFQILTSSRPSANIAPAPISFSDSLLSGSKKTSKESTELEPAAAFWCTPKSNLGTVSSSEEHGANLALVKEVQETMAPFDALDDDLFSLEDFCSKPFDDTDKELGIPVPPLPPSTVCVTSSTVAKEEIDGDAPLELSRSRSSAIREQKRIDSFHPEEWEKVAKALFYDEDTVNENRVTNANGQEQPHLHKYLGKTSHPSQKPADHRSIPAVPTAQGYRSNLRENDVTTGRGAPTNFHPGNLLFRELVLQHQTAYLCAKRSDKPSVAMKVLEILESRDGRMVKRNKVAGRFQWEPIDRKAAFDKVCSALRDGAPELRRKLIMTTGSVAGGHKKKQSLCSFKPRQLKL